MAGARSCLRGKITWEKMPTGILLDGDVYGDGSGLFPRIARLRRCGWGITCYAPGRGIIARAYGPLPGWLQDVPAAESYALLIALRFCSETLTFYTDCKAVLKWWRLGPRVTGAASFKYAAVWRQIRARVADVGYDAVKVIWR